MTIPHTLPTITDGYIVRSEDLDFLGLDEAAVKSYCDGMVPLGMTQSQYSDFKTTLHAAIKSDGLDITAVKIGLKGSSVEFFSGHHKPMPFEGLKIDRRALRAEFRKGHKRPATQVEIEIIIEKLVRQWPPELQRPRRRPFDAFHKLGICEQKSDYDVNLSSNEIMSRVVDLAKDIGLHPKSDLIIREPYGFINKKLFNLVFPEIEDWRKDQSEALGRPVTVAAFPACGPPNKSKKIGPLSSHFRSTDWKW